jgi:hypothetical protein
MLLAIGDDLLLACLLLLAQLLACPSPPGLAAGPLSFSSWLDLELQLDSMVLLEMFVWWCARTVDVLGVVQCWTCECCSPGTTHLVDCLALLEAVVLPAPASPSVTKLLVSCVPACTPSLVWSPPWPCCAYAMHPYTLYPQWFFKEQMLTWSITLNDAMVI